MKGSLVRCCACFIIWSLINGSDPGWVAGSSLYDVSVQELEDKGVALFRRGRALGQSGAVIEGLPIQQGWLKIDGKITRLGKELRPGRHTISFHPMSYPPLPTPPDRYKSSMRALGKQKEEITFIFELDARPGHIYEIMTVFTSDVQGFDSYQELLESSGGQIHGGYFSEEFKKFEMHTQYVECYIIDRITAERVAGETKMRHRMVTGPELPPSSE